MLLLFPIFLILGLFLPGFFVAKYLGLRMWLGVRRPYIPAHSVSLPSFGREFFASPSRFGP